jgi:hypothetical protein
VFTGVNAVSMVDSSSDVLQYTFTDLTPGQLYQVSVTTVNQGIQSDQASVQLITGRKQHPDR